MRETYHLFFPQSICPTTRIKRTWNTSKPVGQASGSRDVLGKPYDFDTPRLDVWLNLGRAK